MFLYGKFQKCSLVVFGKHSQLFGAPDFRFQLCYEYLSLKMVNLFGFFLPCQPPLSENQWVLWLTNKGYKYTKYPFHFGRKSNLGLDIDGCGRWRRGPRTLSYAEDTLVWASSGQMMFGSLGGLKSKITKWIQK